ncbi:putative GTP-binding protein YjiA [Aquisphaera giovannonii]|uniref:Putative GTP-binding protein YjiA n=1 Tax=Aquisphaera giovannonii TaxID=406548 RepID=A0A5B9WBA0_9BACT|nr:GTP-binding protein [Aquisphaera giovannonii]QEH37160.1 putative GTP-binding protein YjiA [Aquisphaera giovannonii]
MADGPIRFVLVGGFLGAGKTTAIARLARMYRDRGLRVGIITNDQADDLVDTLSLRAQGFDVGEVSGACFCCHFNELTRSAAELTAGARPDVILAEPVGSCTDLVATVVRPLMRYFGGEYEVGPYCVLVKPEYASRLLDGDEAALASGTSYIFRKQLEEADVILINKVDALDAVQVGRLDRLARETNPAASILHASARTGEGFDSLIDRLDGEGPIGARQLDVDYDAYADGEAELGWLNATAQIRSPQPISVDDLVLSIARRIGDSLPGEDADIAHLKVAARSGPLHGVASVVDNRGGAALSIPAAGRSDDVAVTVNARVAMEPAILEDTVRRVLADACGERGLSLEVRDVRSFRPGRPVPVHRLS